MGQFISLPDGRQAALTILTDENGNLGNAPGTVTATEGTYAAMRADEDLLTSADENKRWITTDAPIGSWSYRLVGGVWAYYPEAAADANGAIPVTSSRTITLIDTNADGYKYICEAAPGTATSAAAWSITRISSGNPQEFLLSPADSVCDDRATTVTYS